MELVVATKNRKKFIEIKHLLKDLNLKVGSLLDFSHTPRIVENGKIFEANAKKKAIKIANFTGKLTLGEDSGLEVEVLKGKPGVYSSRFAGYPKSDARNNAKLLRLLQDVPLKKRKAQYFCAVAIADSNGLIDIKTGTCNGLIGFAQKGKSGFGYDPLFIIPKYHKTFAQLGLKIKHKMSHRFKALNKAKICLKKYLAAQKGR